MSKQIQHTVTYEDGRPCPRPCCNTVEKCAGCGRSFARGKYIKTIHESVEEPDNKRRYYYITWKTVSKITPHTGHWQRIENTIENLPTLYWNDLGAARISLNVYRLEYPQCCFALNEEILKTID